jgi:hypothetical protein
MIECDNCCNQAVYRVTWGPMPLFRARLCDWCKDKLWDEFRPLVVLGEMFWTMEPVRFAYPPRDEVN